MSRITGRPTGLVSGFVALRTLRMFLLALSFLLIVCFAPTSTLDAASANSQGTTEAVIQLASTITYGQTLAGEIAVPGEEDAFTFSATAGDAVHISLSDDNAAFFPEIQLYDPAGVFLGNARSNSDHTELEHILSTDGTYIILVADSPGTKTASYHLSLQQLNAPSVGTPIVYGDTLAGSIDLPADTDAFTFSATAGDAVHISLSDDNAAFFPEIQLYDPAGVFLGNARSNSDHTELEHILSTDGTYTILVADSPGTETASYHLSLQQLNAPSVGTPIVYGDTLAGSIDLPADTDAFTFSATAGDAVHISLSDDNAAFSPEIRLYGPTGALLSRNASPSAHVELEHNLQASGTYTVLIADNSGVSTANYHLSLQQRNAPPAATPIAYGDTLAGSIVLPSEVDAFTFNAAAGDAVHISLSDDTAPLSAFGAEIRLYDPTGTFLSRNTSSSPHVQLEHDLPVGGTYTLLVADNSGVSTANYHLSLQQRNAPPAATPVAYGDTLAGSIVLPSEVDAFTFNATAGDAVHISLSDDTAPLSAFGAEIRLYDPTGAFLSRNTSPSAHVELEHNLQASGTYTVLVADNSGVSSANYHLGLQQLNAPTNATAARYRDTPNGSIDLPAEMDAFTFSATAGDVAYISLIDDSAAFFPEIRLYDPTGAFLSRNTSPSNEVELVSTLSDSGTHTILVGDNSGVSTASYTLAIGNNAVPLAPDVTIQQQDGTLHFSWSDANPNTRYEIHRSRDPYFTPDDATLVQVLEAPVTEYTDTLALGNPDDNYFYLVRARVTGNDNVADSNVIGEFDFALTVSEP